VNTLDVAAYLERIGLSDLGSPCLADLERLHMANVEKVAFETISRPEGVDLTEAFDRIVYGGWGGTCFHLNGVFALVLEALGYQVRLHPAGVHSIFNPSPPGPDGTHIILTVCGLPTDANPGGRWVADVGSGEGFHRPLPLTPGSYRLGEFTYRVRPSDTGPDCWRIDYDERESCRGVDFADAPADLEEYAEKYGTHADGAWGVFYRYGWAKRHHGSGFDELIGLLHSSVGLGGRETTEIADQETYFTVLRDVFGMGLYQLTAVQRDELWDRVSGGWSIKNFAQELPASLRRQPA
jgi:N-hydroxyarylamine O-acetyltransferase